MGRRRNPAGIFSTDNAESDARQIHAESAEDPLEEQRQESDWTDEDLAAYADQEKESQARAWEEEDRLRDQQDAASDEAWHAEVAAQAKHGK